MSSQMCTLNEIPNKVAPNFFNSWTIMLISHPRMGPVEVEIIPFNYTFAFMYYWIDLKKINKTWIKSL